ncbi:MAG: acetate--CoA ligase family protein [Caulobacteraceae bacterium]|nr:acetate--CoA ligase family protein [Caulobacteraceae bacterium]
MSIQSLLTPASAAVIGVSEAPEKLGSRVMRNLLAAGFEGRVYGVGRGCHLAQVSLHPDAAALPEPVDVAFLAVPAAATVEAAEQCAARGVRSIVVGAAGFAEDGDEAGVARQAALARLARESGMRIVGPNCNGLYNPHHRFSLGFNTGHEQRLVPGGVALLSHSGALFEAMARRIEALGAGLSLFISLGNEADLDVLQLMESQIANPATRVIALLIDALADGERFAVLAAQAREAGKSIVVLKLGHSDAGSDAATAHSSRLVGDSEGYRALFRRCGVAYCRTLEGFTTAAALLDRFGRRSGGVGAISISGAGGALLADIAARHETPLPAYADATHERLGKHRRFSKLVNPTDLGVFAGAVSHSVIVSAIAEDPGVGAVVLQVHSVPGAGRRMIEALGTSQAATGKAHVLLAPGGLPEGDLAAAAAAGVVVLNESDAAIQALGALVGLSPVAPLQAAPNPCPRPASVLLGEAEALALLREFGLPATSFATCSSREEAVAAGERIGWPVALKAASDGLAHKSDQGLVQLGLKDAAELEAAYERMGRPDRVIVQPMARGDLEIIIGLARAPGSGVTLLAGLGGVFAEALDQTVKWSVPASREDLIRQLGPSALGRVLSSPRWRIPGALDALVEVLLRLQAFALAAQDWVEAVDVNPLIATPSGLVAVDALIRSRSEAVAGAAA